jgi:O-antigen chain-terminating methyltransferase
VDADGDLKTEELTAIINGIRDRVRARYPQGTAGSMNVPLPDLMPVVHARDAAEAKVAAIGTVNPRPPGPINSLIQFVKTQVARALDWHVREQIEFNRAAMSCIEALLTALNEANRSLSVLTGELETLRSEVRPEEINDLRGNWIESRQEWERKLQLNETQFLRRVAELQSAYQHRTALMEGSLRDQIRSQHGEFTVTLERTAMDIQKRLWADLERMRTEYERLIHNELRVLRQRGMTREAAPAAVPAVAGASPSEPQFDYLRFAERFRGSEEYVRAGQQFYKPYFADRREVLDIGCGRGEFLEFMREMKVPARGIELSAESVAICEAKGLRAEKADLFEYLPAAGPSAFDAIFCSQVVEHLPPERLPEVVHRAAASLERGGVLAVETPNPECLAIFATHFYLDPTHTRPVPPGLMVFYMEEAGFGNIEVHRLSPAVDSMPSLASLPADFREAFFGGLDYAIVGRKL